jgi:thiamine biosynthesis lipoprotein
MAPNRRRALPPLRLATVAVLLLVASLAGEHSRASSSSGAPGGASGALRSVVFPGRAMGTYTRVVLVASDSAAVAPFARIALEVFARVDSLMSNWTTVSEVARLNREAAAGPTPVHPEVARVIQTSLEVWRDSEGANDITVEPLVRAWGFIGGPPRVPTPEEVAAAFRLVGARQLHFDAARRTLRFERPGVKIDLGGIAKGYSVDVVVDSLKAHGVTNALVEISGNMVGLGAPVGANQWRIGIRDPRDRLPYFARIELRDQAVSTSGKYQQFVAQGGKTYGHIMDPRTGRPAEGLISVTVVAPTAMACDAWDTPLFVLGLAEAKRKAKERGDLSVVLVEPGVGGVDTVWVESDLKDRFILEPSARPLFQVEYF